MKTIALFIMMTVMTVAMPAQEQIKKGVYSLGGSIALASESITLNGVNSTETFLSFSPSASYFIIDQVELKLDPTYRRLSSGTALTTLGLDLGVRYYFQNEKFTPFIGASGGMQWSALGDQPYSSPTSNIVIIGGIEIFLSTSVAVEPAVSYLYENMSDYSMTIKEFQFGIGIKYFILH
jgi:hypothetical protein